MWRSLFMLLVLVAAGCGPSAQELRERTLSILNTEADRWDGGQEFTTTATDAWGRPLRCRVKKTALDYVLEVGSAGPDGLAKNSDDIIVTRSKRHGESSLAKEAGKAIEEITRGGASGAARGTIEGAKKGLGLGGGGSK